MNIAHCNRRDFIKATGLSVSGLLLGCRTTSAKATNGKFVPNAYIAISKADGVILSIATPEIGQNIRTTFAMILADELSADLDTVTLHQASPRDDIGRQTTAGSGSVRRQFEPMRQAAATVREMLISGAAKKWDVSTTKCHADRSMIYGPNGMSMRFADAAELALNEAVPSAPKLKSPSEFKYIGKETLMLDRYDLASGKTLFGIDAMPENLAFAVVLRSPVNQGTLKRFDASVAMEIPGVKDVIDIGDKVAVIANNTWTAMTASRAVTVEWDDGRYGGLNSEDLAETRKKAIQGATQEVFKKGDFESSFAESPIQLEHEFVLPTIAHVTMEPPVCTAWVHDGIIEIWSVCQALDQLFERIPDITGFPREKIVYHQLRTGGGFGRKLRADYLEEAVAIAKKVDYPVKMMFTREDDIHHDYFRLPDHVRYRIGLSKNGYPEAIEETSVRRSNEGRGNHIINLFNAAVRKFNRVDPGQRGGALRAPHHNILNFIDQSLFDIIADTMNADPIDYQLALHGDKASMRTLGWSDAPSQVPEMCEVLEAVKKRSGWKTDSRFGYGLATFSGYGSHCALVALIEKENARRPVERVYAAVHCGTVINPLGAHAQIEGGIVDAVGATLYQKITMKDGRVVQSNFHDYKLLRINEQPDIDIYIADSDAGPQGLGEVSYPPTAAAITNAIYDANGTRVTELPLRG